MKKFRKLISGRRRKDDCALTHAPETPLPGGYKYAGLPSGQWMRLLSLLPGTGDDPIKFELFTAQLSIAPPYEAISYAWGDHHDRQDVICCGYTTNITKSLFTGLKRFRYPEGPRVLWADAICIDQSNNEEKGHQVDMMANVYDRAFRVLVWLGEASNHAGEKVVRIIRNVNNYIDSTIPESELAIQPTIALMSVPRPQDEDQLFQDKSEIEGLRAFFTRPWFTRVWVLQEVALASSAEVFYGATSIALSGVVQAAYILATRSDFRRGFQVGPVGVLSDAFTVVFSTFGKHETWIEERSLLRHLRDFTERRVILTLINILDTGARFQATNPRDYVYAFLGHPLARTNNGTSCILEADYKLSMEGVFKLLVQRLYDRDRRVDFLARISHINPVDMNRSSSWLPRFGEGPVVYAIDQPDWNVDNSNEIRDLVKADFRNDMLRGSGLKFNSIVYCSENFNLETFRTINPNPVESCWKLQADSTACAYSANERLLAFCWTLVGGSYAGGERKLELDFQSYCHQKISSAFCATLKLANFPPEKKSSVDGDWMVFETQASNSMLNRKFFVTSGGFFGLGPALLQKGDLCCILLGCRIPLVIRLDPSTSYFKLVGASYIHGIMTGQLAKARITSISQLDDITLV